MQFIVGCFYISMSEMMVILQTRAALSPSRNTDILLKVKSALLSRGPGSVVESTYRLLFIKYFLISKSTLLRSLEHEPNVV